MDYGDFENQQLANYLTNQQYSTAEQIMRNRFNQQNSRQLNINWRSVLAAKELLDDDSSYRLPIGFTFFSLIRIIFTLFALNYTQERSQFIQVFTSVGLFKDLLQIFYNYLLFRSIQKLKKLLYQHQFEPQLLHFLNEISDKDFSVKHKSTLVINCILKTNTLLRLFEKLIKMLSWGLFLYSIIIISITDLKKEISGISIPLIIVFTFSNYCILTVMIVFFFYSVLFNITSSIKNVFFKFQARYNKYRMSRLINNLPCTKYENIKDKQNITSCAVCLVDYTSSDRVLQLSCSTQHHFHKECIKTWLDIKSNCPICRTPVFESISKPTHQPIASNSQNNSQIQALNNQSQQQLQSQGQSNNSSPSNIQQENPQTIALDNSSNREKSKSEPSASSYQLTKEKMQTLIENQQFLIDMQNQSPNKQIIEMVEENLYQYESYFEKQQQLQEQQQQQLQYQKQQESNLILISSNEIEEQ